MAKGKKKEESKPAKEHKELTAFQKEIRMLLVLLIAVFFLLGYCGKVGILGVLLSNLAFGLAGFLAYILPFFMVGFIWFYLANIDNKRICKKCICVLIMVVVCMAILELMTYPGEKTLNVVQFCKQSAQNRNGGGLIGGLLANLLSVVVDDLGAYLILFALLTVGFMYLTEKLLFQSLRKKGTKAYHRMKEQVELAVQEREEEREREEELEDYEELQEKSRPRLPFFSFKREADLDSLETEEEEQEDRITVSGDMKEITISKPQEEAVEMEEEQENTDEELSSLSQLIIHRADQLLEEEQEDEQEKEQENSLSLQGGTQMSLEDLDFSKEESNGGVVLDAEEKEADHSPQEALRQLSQPQTEDVKRDAVAAAKMENQPTAQETAQVAAAASQAQKKKPKYIFPSPDLLSKVEKTAGDSDQVINEKAQKLRDTLRSFGVKAELTNISYGPTVTRFELQPAQGVKVSKITALSDDIKLNMAAEEIRIEAPIPGKAAVGIEIPNDTTSMVHFRELVENKQFKANKSKLSFAVGKDIGGQVVVTDIAKMPHLLIAGATGSGKSVCINTLIMSILYKAHPDDVKMIMIDPKVVELSCYQGIPHLLIPVVTEPKKASAALQWAVQEMTVRYQKFAELGVKEISSYNNRVKAVEYAQDERYQKMPQIVIIVDELADLMMVASKEVEDSICRLAQLARAAGIHLVIATQRPSVNVITGLIKANIPSRIAFAVSSTVDSRTILDSGGAEKLLGKGDMLFYPAGIPKPVRVQGAFISETEVNAVVDFIKSQNDTFVEESKREAEMQSQAVASVHTETVTGAGEENGNDAYFAEAGKFIIEKNKASIGMLQRVYKIGFNRAARIMDQLCAAGVVGPEMGTKPREVLMTKEEFEAYLSN